MQEIRGVGRAVACVLFVFAAAANARQSAPLVDRSGIAVFNKTFTEAIRSMNNEAVLSLWEDDGIALLPDTKPVLGKPAMRTMLHTISSARPKAEMKHFTNECFDVAGSGPWASEWCLEHQVVSEPGKPTFDSWGKMLLVLHRQPSGEWRLVREMWNQGAHSERPSLAGSEVH